MRDSHRIDKSKLVDKIYMLYQLRQTNAEMSEQIPEKHHAQVRRIRALDDDSQRKAA
jgi:hypothetical protein